MKVRIPVFALKGILKFLNIFFRSFIPKFKNLFRQSCSFDKILQCEYRIQESFVTIEFHVFLFRTFYCYKVVNYFHWLLGELPACDPPPLRLPRFIFTHKIFKLEVGALPREIEQKYFLYLPLVYIVVG